jgi:DNA-binding MarR family transcriptional regulator
VQSVSVPDLHAIGARCFVRAVRRTSNLITRVYNSYFKLVGLEATQFCILCAIAGSKAQSTTELADVLGIEKSTLKRSLDRMVLTGMIVPTQGEGRRIMHRLTSLGGQKLDAALPLWHQVQDEMEELLPPSKADEIRSDLRLLLRRARTLAGTAAR